VLQCVAVCCVCCSVQRKTSTTKHTLFLSMVLLAAYCRVLQSVAECCSVLQFFQCVAVCRERLRQQNTCHFFVNGSVRSVLQCVAACCSMLQCVTVCCGVLQCVAVCCSIPLRVAACCSVLQCVAVCVKSWGDVYLPALILVSHMSES